MDGDAVGVVVAEEHLCIVHSYHSNSFPSPWTADGGSGAHGDDDDGGDGDWGGATGRPASADGALCRIRRSDVVLHRCCCCCCHRCRGTTDVDWALD